MSYKIIIDSCGELTEEMKKSGNFETASLQIDVGGHQRRRNLLNCIRHFKV